ncbi:MAG: 2-hydroxyacid dehydrogenase [Janthinobacterium lividum]
MRITCAFPESEAEQLAWVNALRRALPEARVEGWRSGDAPADYAVVWRAAQPFFDAQPELKAIFNAGAGVDGLARCTLPPSAVLVRIEDAGMAEQMADYVTHAVLHYYREFDTYAAQAGNAEWRPRAPRNKAQYPVGLLGFGVLGQAVAKTLMALGFPVHAWTRLPREHDEVRLYAGQGQLPQFLAATRMLVCLLPLTAQTSGLLDRRHLSMLQQGAYLINVARGGHVVQSELLEAIDMGQIAGATLDVCEPEPLPGDHPFWRHPRIRLTPHISAATLREPAVAQIAEKLRQIEAGMNVTGIVRHGRGY